MKKKIAANMMWNTHTEQTAAKGNKKLVFLKRNLKINNPDIKSRAYKTLVRPTLECYNMVWGSHTAILSCFADRDDLMLGCQVDDE